MLAVFIVFGGVCVWYVNDYYHCEQNALDVLRKPGTVQITEIQEGYFLDGTGEENAMIFYPGAKVEAESYLPILYSLAEKGVDCFLVEMPCNLAILGMNKADTILDRYEYEKWYMSGHSLGGAMAASYASKHINTLDGMICFAAYTTEKLKTGNFRMLSIYGSEDKVLNIEKIVEGRNLVPEDYKEICIEGGNHAYFGNYGEQEGDGKATISREEQQKETTKLILEFISIK